MKEVFMMHRVIHITHLPQNQVLRRGKLCISHWCLIQTGLVSKWIWKTPRFVLVRYRRACLGGIDKIARPGPLFSTHAVSKHRWRVVDAMLGPYVSCRGFRALPHEPEMVRHYFIFVLPLRVHQRSTFCSRSLVSFNPFVHRDDMNYFMAGIAHEDTRRSRWERNLDGLGWVGLAVGVILERCLSFGVCL